MAATTVVVLDHHAPAHRARPRRRRHGRDRDRRGRRHRHRDRRRGVAPRPARRRRDLLGQRRRARPSCSRPAVDAVDGVEVYKVSDRTFLLHIGGKIEVTSKVPLRNRDDLSMAYTPGVGRVSMALAEQPRGRPAADHQGQLGRRRHRRLGGARARQHRPRRGAAGDGGQGRAVQAVRRHRRLADLPGHPGHRRDRRARSR